jgi:hypothetical protein
MRRALLTWWAAAVVALAVALGGVQPAAAEPVPEPPAESAETTPAGDAGAEGDPSAGEAGDEGEAAANPAESPDEPDPEPAEGTDDPADESVVEVTEPGAEADWDDLDAADAALAAETSGNGTTLTYWTVPRDPAAETGEGVLVRAGVTELATFSLVGLAWDTTTGPAPTFAVSLHTADGWSEWYDFGAAGEGDVAELGGTATDAVWVGDSDGIRVEVRGEADTAIAGLQAVLITTTGSQVATARVLSAGVLRVASGTNYLAQPTIVTRAQWGAVAPTGAYDCGELETGWYDDSVEAAVVHHTAGTNTYTQAQSAGIVRGIQAYHISQVWCDIGYNFLIDQYGTIYEGRIGGIEYPVHGAHAFEWNANTAGISLMMNSETAQPTSAALTSLERLIAWKLGLNYRDPLSTVTLVGVTLPRIFGHGDVNATSCPGANVKAQMDTIRQAVAALINAADKSPIQQAWEALGGVDSDLGAVFRLESPISGGRFTQFEHGAIYWNSATGEVWTLMRGIGAAYVDAGGPASDLGWPVEDSQKTSNGGWLQHFEGGLVYSAPNGNGYRVTGAVLTAYDSAGGQSALGWPIADAYNVSGGTRQDFAKGYIMWTASGGATVTLASTIASGLSGRTFAIRSALNSNQVIDVPSSSQAWGTQLQLWPANKSDAQSFMFECSQDYCVIRNVNSGLVLDVKSSSTASGTAVQQWPENGSAAQQWVPVANSDGTYTFVSRLGLQVALTTAGGSSASGALLQIGVLSAAKAQRWSLLDMLDESVVTPPVTPPTTSDLNGRTFVLRSALSASQVVDVPGSSKSWGQQVQLWGGNGSNAQAFRFECTGDWCFLRNVASGFVLDVRQSSTRAGTAVQQWPYNGSTAQQWRAQLNSDGTYTLISRLSSQMVLDVPGSRTASGTMLQIWSSNGTKAQRWYLLDIDYQASSSQIPGIVDGYYTITSALSASSVVDIPGSSKTVNVRPQLWTPNGSNAQLFRVTWDAASGYYTIRSAISGMALTVNSGVLTPGPYLVQQSYNGGVNQQWAIGDMGDGTFSIQARRSGLAWEVTSGKANAGNPLQLALPGTAKAQRFTLTFVR